MIKAQIKLLHVDDDEAYYCRACWLKSLEFMPLGGSEEFETLPEETEQWCEFSLTHQSVYEEKR